MELPNWSKWAICGLLVIAGLCSVNWILADRGQDIFSMSPETAGNSTMHWVFGLLGLAGVVLVLVHLAGGIKFSV